MFNILRALPDNAIRKEKISTDPYRKRFVRDRDRILFSKEFRRLGGKTQVFTPEINSREEKQQVPVKKKKQRPRLS